MLKATSYAAFAFIMSAAASFSQEHCANALRFGAYDFFRSSTNAAANSTVQNGICDTYNSFRQDIQSGGASASYGMFDGSVTLSRQQVESLGKVMCSSDYSQNAQEQVVSNASSVISPAAMEAYRECLQLNSVGLRVNITPRVEDLGAVAVQVSYLAFTDANRPAITSISVEPEQDIKCEGTLWDVVQQIPQNGPQKLNSSRSMLCTRTLHASPVLHGGRGVVAPPATIQVETEAGSMTYHMPAVPLSAGPDEMELLRRQIVPVGAFILMADACPSHYYRDVSAEYPGRLLMVSTEALEGNPIVRDGDGSHAHGAHAHGIDLVTSTARGNAHERRGQENVDASHVDHTHRVQGTTASAEIQGGAHEHASVGFKLCQKTASPVVASN
jgi:hypothetical protein